jgi:hypothetical protein
MKNRLTYACLAALLAAGTMVRALAQTTPAPSPQATMAPVPVATNTPAATATPHPAATNSGKHLGQIKKIPKGNLSLVQVTYGLTHLPQEISSLRKLHKVKFSNLRVQRVPTTLHKLIHTSQIAVPVVAYEPVTLSDALAQTPAPTAAPSGLLGSLLNIIANINISDALNNALNGNTVDLSLSNVLNGNKIAIGQVVGVYVGGAGIITTLLK